MAKTKEQEAIQLRFALTFTRLLAQNKTQNNENKVRSTKAKIKIATLGQLSSDTGLRPATLSDIFLGRSNVKGISIDLILESLGKTFSEFGQVYDGLTERQIVEFKSEIEKAKKYRERIKQKNNKKK